MARRGNVAASRSRTAANPAADQRFSRPPAPGWTERRLVRPSQPSRRSAWRASSTIGAGTTTGTPSVQSSVVAPTVCSRCSHTTRRSVPTDGATLVPAPRAVSRRTNGRRQSSAGGHRRLSVPAREAPARLLDEELARRQIPGLQILLGIDLGLALGDEAVARVVAESPLPVGRVDEPHELRPAPGPADGAQARVHEESAGEIALGGDRDALAVEESAGTPAGRVEIAGD